MKKLHIINLGKMGGVERLFLQYINDTHDGSNEVICISGEIDKDISQKMPNQKVTFANRLFNSSSIRCPQFLRKYLLQKRVNDSNADIIIVWDLVPRLIAKPRRGKVVYYDHGCSWRFPKNHKTLNFFAMLDGVITASEACKRVMELRFNLPCPHQVVINRIVTPPGSDSPPKALSSPLKIGTASRQVTLKGISVSLLMLRELLQRGHDVSLEIAGKGPDQETFMALAESLQLGKHVTFSGFQHDMEGFFKRIHLYMSTPVTEPFGLSCMEALYYGVPVIFPVIDGQPEVIKEGECGIGLIPTVSIEAHQSLTGLKVDFPYDIYDPVSDSLSEPKLLSHQACADTVEKFMSPELYDRYSHNAKRYAFESFDYSLFKSELDGALNKIINK